VIAVAEAFRWASRRIIEERSAKLAERDLLFRELNHRIKNTFAMIAGLIELQRRRAAEKVTQETLADLARRLDSIARAHHDLYRSTDAVGTIDLGAYLQDFCSNLPRALFDDGAIKLECTCASAPMERDRAIAIGLIVNELVVNAAKHAFSDSANPTISVVLKENGAGWRLIVCDNGRGLPPDGEPSNGLGRGLIAALVRQIKGVLTRSNTPGATFQIDLPA
jgi:two-component sensor histidine kinase